MTPAGQLLVALDAFFALYQVLRPSLNVAQLEMLARRLGRYEHEVSDDITRAQA